MNSLDPRLLSAALDDATQPALDEVMDYFLPDPPFLTFGSPATASTLSLYGRTVLASRNAFGSPFGTVSNIETRVAGPEDPLVFPPNRFGLVHARWIPLTSPVITNLMRWLRKDGVLFIEAPDDYPARNLPRGPYQAVAQAVADRMNLPPTAHLPGLLIRHGLADIGCRHRAPSVRAFREMFTGLVEGGTPWPEVEDADLRDWSHDPVRTPAFTNVMAWGVKTYQ